MKGVSTHESMLSRKSFERTSIDVSRAFKDSWFFLFLFLYFLQLWRKPVYSSNLAPIEFLFSPLRRSSSILPIERRFSLLRWSSYMNSIKSSVDICLFMATKRIARLTGDAGVCIEELFKARDLVLGCGTRVGLDDEDDEEAARTTNTSSMLSTISETISFPRSSHSFLFLTA